MSLAVLFNLFPVLSGLGVFCLGLSGLILRRRSLLFLLLCLELVLLGMFLCFAHGSVLFDAPFGQIYALAILVSAAAESAIGLSLLISYRRAGNDSFIGKCRRLRG